MRIGDALIILPSSLAPQATSAAHKTPCALGALLRVRRYSLDISLERPCRRITVSGEPPPGPLCCPSCARTLWPGWTSTKCKTFTSRESSIRALIKGRKASQLERERESSALTESAEYQRYSRYSLGCCKRERERTAAGHQSCKSRRTASISADLVDDRPRIDSVHRPTPPTSSRASALWFVPSFLSSLHRLILTYNIIVPIVDVVQCEALALWCVRPNGAKIRSSLFKFTREEIV